MLFVSCTSSKSNDTSAMSEVVTENARPPDDTQAEKEKVNYINPKFSVKGGMYDSSQTLALSLPEDAPSGAYITYTTDGEEPRASGTRADRRITVCDRASSCIRASCFSESGQRLGRIVTNTYIYAEDGRFDTVVISLVAASNDLYGRDGIIANPTGSGKEWERACHVEMFTSSGEEMVSQDAGIRIFGGSSRTLAQKSFRLVARADGYYDELKYNGNGSFDYPIFDDRYVIEGENKGKLLERYDRLILRNGGNDSMQHYSQDGELMTLTRDGVANNFALKYAPNVPAQASRPAVVYLNGVYYGILDLKEDINDDYFSNLYGIENKDDITIIKSELDTTRQCEWHYSPSQCRYCGVWFYYELDDGAEGELESFDAICQKIVNCNERDRGSVYKELCKSFDIDNLIQYTALNLFACNTDWGHNNLRVWRYSGTPDPSNPYKDGRYRFAMRDMDFSFGRYESHALPELYTKCDTDMFSFTLGRFYSGADAGYGDPLYLKGILNFCLKNDDFRTRFEKYARSLCESDTLNELMRINDSFISSIKDEIPYHIERWADTISYNMSPDCWSRACTLQRQWITQRKEYFLDSLGKCLKNY